MFLWLTFQDFITHRWSMTWKPINSRLFLFYQSISRFGKGLNLQIYTYFKGSKRGKVNNLLLYKGKIWLEIAIHNWKWITRLTLFGITFLLSFFRALQMQRNLGKLHRPKHSAQATIGIYFYNLIHSITVNYFSNKLAICIWNHPFISNCKNHAHRYLIVKTVWNINQIKLLIHQSLVYTIGMLKPLIDTQEDSKSTCFPITAFRFMFYRI